MLHLAVDEPGDTVHHILRDGLIDGLLISTVAFGHSWVEELLDARLPTVLIGRHPTRDGVGGVDGYDGYCGTRGRRNGGSSGGSTMTGGAMMGAGITGAGATGAGGSKPPSSKLRSRLMSGCSTMKRSASGVSTRRPKATEVLMRNWPPTFFIALV